MKFTAAVFAAAVFVRRVWCTVLVRNRTVATLCRQAKELYENTGCDEISLTSLSISDYTDINELTNTLVEWSDANIVSLSLPSLRADSFTKELMDKVSTASAHQGLTFAPEALEHSACAMPSIKTCARKI